MTEHRDNDVSIALFDLLKGAAAITDLLKNGADSVYEDLAEENAEWPYLVYNEASGVTNYALGDSEDFTAFLYQVKAVAAGPSAAVAAGIRDVVESVLSDAALSIPGRHVLVCAKVSNVRMSEISGGTRYTHRGGIYRIWTEGA